MNCVSVFRSLNETVNEVIEIGKSEGFTHKEIGQFISQEMIKSGLSSRTVTRYLPAKLQAKPRGLPVTTNKIKDKMSLNSTSEPQFKSTPNQSNNIIRDKMSLNQGKSRSSHNLALDSLKAQLTDDIDIEAFSMSARHLKPEILGKVIDNLAQIYNEKTGQKIIVIFRKMIDDGTSAAKDKKYQPSPNEVEQRRQRVLSLVKEVGVVRISDLVK